MVYIAAATAGVSDDVFFQHVCCAKCTIFIHQSASMWLANSKASCRLTLLTCGTLVQGYASNSSVMGV